MFTVIVMVIRCFFLFTTVMQSNIFCAYYMNCMYVLIFRHFHGSIVHSWDGNTRLVQAKKHKHLIHKH